MLQLRFAALPGNGAIALAGFSTMVYGICPPTICDFESGNCNWTSTYTNPIYSFKLIKAGNAGWEVSSRQEYDHTTESGSGHFMEASGGYLVDFLEFFHIIFKYVLGNIGDSTNLTSPSFYSFSTNFCLSFWYWRHLIQNNKIDVFFTTPYNNPRTQQIWRSEHTFPSGMWHRAQVNFLIKLNTFITIRATKLGEFYVDCKKYASKY